MEKCFSHERVSLGLSLFAYWGLPKPEKTEYFLRGQDCFLNDSFEEELEKERDDC